MTAVYTSGAKVPSGYVLTRAFHYVPFLRQNVIYSLKVELNTIPEAMLFSTAAVYLITEGSSVLTESKTLDVQGAVISRCGTCFDCYGMYLRFVPEDYEQAKAGLDLEVQDLYASAYSRTETV
jgi:hypothetical protein